MNPIVYNLRNHLCTLSIYLLYIDCLSNKEGILKLKVHQAEEYNFNANVLKYLHFLLLKPRTLKDSLIVLHIQKKKKLDRRRHQDLD